MSLKKLQKNWNPVNTGKCAPCIVMSSFIPELKTILAGAQISVGPVFQPGILVI